MIWLFRYVSEYQTERELFQNLSNENLDKVWLLNCSSQSDHPILIVNDAGENVAIGAEVQVIHGENRNNEEAEDLSNFITCLMKKWEERKKKRLQTRLLDITFPASHRAQMVCTTGAIKTGKEERITLKTMKWVTIW